MVKVNRDELLGLADAERLDAARQAAHRAPSIPEIAARMVALRARGIELVVATLEADGVLLADVSGVVHASVPPIEVVNPTGSGDLVLAGLAVGIERGQSVREALLLGAAGGTAGATHLLPELPPDFDADAWTARIAVTAVRPT
jgi:fructose-1-phosphate kinase PfkB-like protein